MSTTTRVHRCIPSRSSGIVVTLDTSVGPWKEIAPRTSRDMYLVGLFYTNQHAASADANFSFDIFVGFGRAGFEVTHATFSSVLKNDTAVGYYLPAYFFLPEPILIPALTRVSVCGQANSNITNAIVRLLVQSDIEPIDPSDTNKMQNYMNAGLVEKAFS